MTTSSTSENFEVLVAPHTIEYTYTRSTGPMIGAYLTGLREGKILGSRGSDGRVLVPAIDYDPITSETLTEVVEVADTGIVTTWSWVDKPREGQPLQKPFAWALVLVDGANTPFLAAVDAASPDQIRTGVRVRAYWKPGRIGVAGDLTFVLEENP